MRVFNNSYNPCFHGSCLVKMLDGSTKKCENIKKGDKIISPSNEPATIKCVIKTICSNS